MKAYIKMKKIKRIGNTEIQKKKKFHQNKEPISIK